tara:strand:- start:886 stop:1107 length:222 start_codon:yes stop_codon:yes gene_type:complete
MGCVIITSQIKGEKMYETPDQLASDSNILEMTIIEDIVLHCENNRVGRVTQNGLITLIKDNFERERLRRKNRL